MKNKVINLFGNNKVVQNKGVKYSKLLEQFMNPFMNEFEDYEFIEDIFEFAISAWKFGNIKSFVPKEEFEKASYSIQDDEVGILLNKMIDYKVANFKGYENVIIDYELKEVNAGEDPILSVITQEKEPYLLNMMDAFVDDVSENNFDENYINRYAIVIKPQQPFFDWINKLYPDDKISKFGESNIYLVNDEIDDLEKWLQKKFDKFFMMELDDCHIVKKDWPQKRNYKMFKQWFQVDISTMIYDLEKKPVLKFD